ncbi:MAG: DNA repair protein RecN [Gammaproteobacteria bacterium]|nr:DNA repair protein RecN [Gammaproteobacteria bacterium]
MLTHIQIRDFAIIGHLELDFGPGMTVMTGETGAGKSILVDALNLALGDRADSSVVRHGCERADICVEFDIDSVPMAQAWLRERELDAGESCQIRRTIQREGRSRAYINGSPAPLQSLRGLGELLLDIHGQHEHQSLLKRTVQRQIVDACGGHTALLDRVAEHFKSWKALHSRLQTLQDAASDRDARLELLRYQVSELDALSLEAGEYAQLEDEHRRSANISSLQQVCERMLDQLYDNDSGSVVSLLARCSDEIERLRSIDAALEPQQQLLNSAAVQVEEAVADIRHYLGALEVNPERLQWLDTRLADIHDLTRKHRIEADEIPTLHTRLKDELVELERCSVQLEELQGTIDEAAKAYISSAEKLYRARQRAAQQLAQQVTENMQRLGMPGGCFEIVVDRDKSAPFTAHGQEQIVFHVSANPGQPLKPLDKVASGGELSRISLAIQVIAAKNADIATLIFDEVDVGVGGSVAEIVGKQLRSLGESRQVMCVTHLPQVAALGHQHLQVSKYIEGDTTHTRIRSLSADERSEEIARMLGGIDITQQTRDHAKEMISRADV